MEPTDFKNVIVENIPPALFEDAEVAEVKQPRNSKRRKFFYAHDCTFHSVFVFDKISKGMLVTIEKELGDKFFKSWDGTKKYNLLLQQLIKQMQAKSFVKKYTSNHV